MKLKNFDFNEKVLLQPDQINKIKNSSRPFPLTVEIDLTNHCNHRCSFCVWGEHISVDKSTLLKDNLLECIDGMKTLGAKAITFTGGGEPMIHKDFYEILSLSKKTGYDCGLITNGSVITEKNAENLLENLNWLRISMSGGDKDSYFKVQGKDHFELVCKNLKMIAGVKEKLNSKTKIGIRMLITKENVHTLYNLANIIEKIKGINYLQIAPDHDNDDGGQFWHGDLVKNEKEKSEKILKEKNIDFITSGFEILNTKNDVKQNILDIPSKCFAHFYQVAITADGNVTFCKNARFDKNFIIGNINDNSILEVWNSKKNQELENWIKPNNCGLLCKNIRVNLAMEEISKSVDMNGTKQANETKVQDYLKNFPDDPLDINFVG
tara:strand:- start:5079 stop:6218 length:1140 start_codon:yes stop_codon:yes gene_type:complete